MQFLKFYFADVKMNHVRGSGAGAQIRASHSQSDPVSVGKTKFTKIVISLALWKILKCDVLYLKANK